VAGQELPLPAHELGDDLELLGLDNDASTVDGVAQPLYEPCRLELVDHGRHRTGRQARRLAKLTGRQRSTRAEDVQAAPLGPIQAGQLGDRRVEQLLVGLAAANR